MMIAKVVRQEREAYVKVLLTKDPDLSIRAMNRAVVARFGHQIRPHRLLELRRALKVAVTNPQTPEQK